MGGSDFEHFVNGIPEAQEVIVDDALSTKIVLAQDTNEGQKFVDFTKVQNGAVIQLDEAGALLVESSCSVRSIRERSMRKKGIGCLFLVIIVVNEDP